MLSFDNSYKGDEKQQRVAEILGLPGPSGWSILDTHEDLVLVHYNEDADLVNRPYLRDLRGIVLDLTAGCVVAKSFGYTPNAVADTLNPENGSFKLKDQDGLEHTFPVEETIIKRVFEGVVFRVILYKGKVLRITHRKITPLRSRWGASPYFITMYTEAGGPTDEQLFDMTKPYSSSCYVFLVVHPSLLVGTRQKVNHPYIVHLVTHQMTLPYLPEEIGEGLSAFPTNSKINGWVDEPFIHTPQSLSIDDANGYLQFGYYKPFTVSDRRLQTGEALIVYRMVDGSVVDIVKVHSTSFEWRVNMRGNNPNITHQFYRLLDTVYNDIYTDENWRALTQKYIILPKHTEEFIRNIFTNHKGIVTLPTKTISRKIYTTKDSRIYLLWMNYVLSLPQNFQEIGLDIISNFNKDRKDVINWINQLHLQNSDLESNPDIPRRIKQIIGPARQSQFNVKSSIVNFIYKEQGESLYKLVKAMKLSRKPKVASSSTDQSVEVPLEQPSLVSE